MWVANLGAMNALELLRTQHRLVEALFERFDTCDSADKGKVFRQIADNLAAHAAIEEKLFYPAVMADTTADLLKEAVEEHLSAKRVIADLLGMRSNDSNYDAKVKVLNEQIEHHVGEEEKQLFPAVQKTFNKEDLHALGEEMEVMFAELIVQKPRYNVPKEIEIASALPTVK